MEPRTPRLSPARMYERVLASDPAWNGRFFTGVMTTGIYCLPSCKARKPKRQNVRFFPSCEAARAAGLRACKKCHPDDFARGADPVLETVESVVAEIRANPAGFSDARAIVRRLGFGATRTFELFRLHYHTTPASLLLRARIDAAKKILLGPTNIAGSPSRKATASTAPASIAEIAFATGFESLSAFHDNFRQFNGLTPAAYRALRQASSFDVDLPRGYLLGYLRRALGRDTQSVTERLIGDTCTLVVQLEDTPAVLTLRLSPQAVHVEIAATSSPAASAQPETIGTCHAARAHEIVIGLLGLDEDAAAFTRLAKKLGLVRLVSGRAELRISRTSSVFDGLLWSIVGQQINFAFACVLKRRLIERTGTPVGDGLFAPPTPAAIAALDPAELLPLQFSRQKADYVIGLAREIVSGRLDLAALPSMSATRAERTLLAMRGLGPWSVNYVMMRALGFPDCVPLGDTGVTSGLQALLKLAERPDVDATRRLMAMFSPYRSLATAHLWQFDKPIPT